MDEKVAKSLRAAYARASDAFERLSAAAREAQVEMERLRAAAGALDLDIEAVGEAVQPADTSVDVARAFLDAIGGDDFVRADLVKVVGNRSRANYALGALLDQGAVEETGGMRGRARVYRQAVAVAAPG